MEESQTQNLVWYNINGNLEGVVASGSPVQVELGTELRTLNPVQIQYGNSLPNSESSHIILTQAETVNHQPNNILMQPKIVTIAKVLKPKVKSKPERVPCFECGKTFSCNANLRDHLRLHTGERPFSCSECDMSFAQRSNWRLHKRVHTGEKPYMCGVCGKTFARSSHLPGHMRVHTGERPYKCSNCHQNFTSGQALKNHERIHTGEKPFKCEYCNTSFTHSSSLSSHKKRCTGEKRKRGRPGGRIQLIQFKKTETKNDSSITKPRGRPKKRKNWRKNNKRENINPVPTLEPKRENDALQVIIEETTGNTGMESDEGNPIQILGYEEAPLDISINADDIKPLIFCKDNVGNTRYLNTIKSQVDEPTTVYVEDSLAYHNRNSQSPGVEDSNSTHSDEPTKVYIDEHMVQAAASAAGIANHLDLRQEAAVTMATLQHGTLNTVHHGGNTSVYYIKQ